MTKREQNTPPTLSLLALGFMFEHELGHIFNGHTVWLNQELGFRILAEVGASNIPGLSGVDLQTLEMDADAFATLDGYNRLGAADDSFGSRQASTFALIFAYYCVWRMFSGHVTNDLDAILAEDHPPAIYRQRFSIGLVLELLLRDGIYTAETVGEPISAAIAAAEGAFRTLTGVPIAIEIHAPETFQKSGELLARLTENWKLLRPQLDVLKRGGVLAP